MTVSQAVKRPTYHLLVVDLTILPVIGRMSESLHNLTPPPHFDAEARVRDDDFKWMFYYDTPYRHGVDAVCQVSKEWYRIEMKGREGEVVTV